MHRELVVERRWISERRFFHALQYCMLLPGPEATQLAIYIGWMLHRTAGGLIAGSLFVLPSILILLGLSIAYVRYGDVAWVDAALAGVKPIVVAIVLDALLRIGRRTVRRPSQIGIAAAAFGALQALDVTYPLVVVGAALAGLALHASRQPGTAEFEPADVSLEGGDASAVEERRYVINDADAVPAHARISRGRALRIVGTGIALWLAPYFVLIFSMGAGSVHAREYTFFTQAAFVTFGGAYAVLAYVTQMASGPFGWISAAQAVDGLALAETTPGPLIMVLQFIGFLAAWNDPGILSPLPSAVLGALVTTYVTFLPCFIFVLLGGPYVERLRGERRVAAALEGVTAAVLAAILHLSVILGAAVFRPAGGEAVPDLFAVVAAMAGFLALRTGRVGIVPIVLAGGAAGAIRALVT